jgi:hypothetical protein
MSAWWLAPLALSVVTTWGLSVVVGRLREEAEALSRVTVAVRAVHDRPRPRSGRRG